MPDAVSDRTTDRGNKTMHIFYSGSYLLIYDGESPQSDIRNKGRIGFFINLTSVAAFS